MSNKNVFIILVIICVLIYAFAYDPQSETYENYTSGKTLLHSLNKCSNEGQQCHLGNSNTDMYFGANGKYVKRKLHGVIDCNNKTFETDPIPGVAKECYIYQHHAIERLPFNMDKCSNEGQQCDLGNDVDNVYYGANKKYLTKVLSGRFNCDNNTFGGDPMPGIGKECYISKQLPSKPTLQTTTKCSNEGGICNAGFHPNTDVYFGANGKYVSKKLHGNINCNNQTFEIDPAPGVGKECYIHEEVPILPLPYNMIKCANEGQQCNAGTTDNNVYYGANGKYIFKTLADQFTCNNNTFGNDPIPGVSKECYLSHKPTLPQQQNLPSGMIKCANEGQQCDTARKLTHEVYYGANGKYVSKVGAGGPVNCDNNTFGTDPMPGVAKECYTEPRMLERNYA